MVEQAKILIVDDEPFNVDYLGQALEDRIRGIEAGADDFLTKPVNPRELPARIQTAVKMKRAVDRKFGELRQLKDYFAKFVPETVKRLI